MTHPVEPNIEALLSDAYDGPVADDGFSVRVMQKIPAQRKTHHSYSLIAFAAGLFALMWQVLSSSLFEKAWHDLAQAQFSVTVMVLFAVFFGASLLVSAWALTEAE
ncbi:hypothetical protein [Undibacterium macrobrachii]|uniref:Uncharacterized protein n=1 Tax=Undibacterium macrobrachii TaxID=1119058 RepID=A0ABQ2XKD4_9BURK|nr:hypothetical protein [Undibacterium macrobrachii]GGX21090.1 hypothetical protein GCM10011282_29050 [Undibacterium macrobrachii]